MHKMTIKSEEEIRKMKEGGYKLAMIKSEVKSYLKKGVRAADIERLVSRRIKEEGGKPSFKMVPKYFWSTCINVNEGLVHGIPKESVVFKEGDVVSVDMGMYYQGFHTDTSFSVGVEEDDQIKHFLGVGEKALKKAIEKARSKNKIYDISQVIQDTVEKAGFKTIKTLVGHGIGRHLHEEPQIPCFVAGERADSYKIVVGNTLAIEVMYTIGNDRVVRGEDDWTIFMRDGKISALFEDTVAVTSQGPIILTD